MVKHPDLNEISIFAKVVEAGSFVRAAESLELPKSTVSAKVSSLEARLGVTLIRRTTRKLHITDAGKDYYQNCVQALRQITGVEEKLHQGQAVPHGTLRITTPVELGGTVMPQVVREFQKKYPEVQLELLLTDRTVDLVAEGYDLAIRAGELKDSSLISKKLGSVYFALFASPQYLKTNGTPKTVKDLTEHCALHFSALGSRGWQLHGPRGVVTTSLSRQTKINDLNLIKALAVSGTGVALLPTFFCYPEVQKGRLVRVLEDWKSDLRPVRFIYPKQDFLPKKLSAFLEVATEIITDDLRNYSL